MPQPQLFAGATFFSAISSPSSPASYISIMISLPPTNSPLTYSCGMVGQSENSLIPWRISMSCKTSTDSKPTPRCSSIATALLENPHCWKRGVPFMDKTTSLAWITESIFCFTASLISFSMSGSIVEPQWLTVARAALRPFYLLRPHKQPDAVLPGSCPQMQATEPLLHNGRRHRPDPESPLPHQEKLPVS